MQDIATATLWRLLVTSRQRSDALRPVSGPHRLSASCCKCFKAFSTCTGASSSTGGRGNQEGGVGRVRWAGSGLWCPTVSHSEVHSGEEQTSSRNLRLLPGKALRSNKASQPSLFWEEEGVGGKAAARSLQWRAPPQSLRPGAAVSRDTCKVWSPPV